MLTGDTLLFAVRSLMRLGIAARAAYEQRVRDAAIQLDELPMPTVADDDALWAFFYALPRRARVEANGDLAHLWRDERPASDEARAILRAERLRLLSEEPAPEGLGWTASRFAREPAALAVLRQWAPDRAPPGPAARLALELADVALDFTTASPGVLGVGGNGEKVVGAFATTLRELLPDIDDRADCTARPAHYQFAERSLVILFRAGLHVASERADLFIPERQYQALFTAITRPLLTAFDANPLDRPRLAEMRDLLLGPMARAALGSLARNPQALLGRNFDPNGAVGAIAGAVLDLAARGTVKDVFTEDGLLAVYRATLDLAVARPTLFAGGAGDAAVQKTLLAIAVALRNAPAPFGSALAADVAVVVLGALKDNVPGLLRQRDDWQSVGAQLIEDVLGGFGTATGTSVLEKLFTTAETLELVETLMREIVRTPGFVGNAVGRAEVRQVAAALAAALGSPGAALVSAADWIAIARIAAAEVARNPLRLVTADALVPGDGAGKDQLLAQIAGTILDAAAEGFPAAGRGTALLFGATLRSAIELALQAATARAATAHQNYAALAPLVRELEQFARATQIGASAWLQLFGQFVGPVLENGITTNLTAAAFAAALEAR